MRDRVVIYDQRYVPAVTGPIAPNTRAVLAPLNAGEHGFIVEAIYVWPSFNLAGAPADVAYVRALIDGQAWPPAPGRCYIRARANRQMAVPLDERYAVKTVPLGRISPDPLTDTTLKVTPAQVLSFEIQAGPTVGVLATDSVIRVMAVGRIADNDTELQNIYGSSIYDPYGPVTIGDPITGKVTPGISKRLSLTLDNLKFLSGATGQNSPKIFPFWTYGLNNAIIPDVPEFEWTYTQPALHVLNEFEELSFDWTRTTTRALQIRYMGAYLAAGRGVVWWHQPPLRRPGHLNQFFGWVVDAGFPNLLPGGGGVAITPMYQGPVDLAEVGPQILAYNNLTQVRVNADAGTTIAAGDLEIQMRGVDIQF